MIRIPLCWPFNNFRPANWHAPQLERYCRPPSDFGSCRLSGFTFCFATGEEASTPRPSLVESSIACSCALSLGESRSFSTRSGRMETIPPTTRVSTNILLWTLGCYWASRCDLAPAANHDQPTFRSRRPVSSPRAMSADCFVRTRRCGSVHVRQH